MSEDRFQREINELRDIVKRAYVFEVPRFIPLTAPLTSTSWDGDARSTTAKTLIDLSAVFAVPAGVKAVAARLVCRDSASAADNTLVVALAPNDTAGVYAVSITPGGLTNDYLALGGGICPCNADGDIYYQIIASGVDTMDVWLTIWGYWI